MKFKSLLSALLIASANLWLLTGTGNAGNPVSGSKAAAMGTAFVGIADDPTTIFSNPAGLGNLDGFQIYSGLTGFTSKSSFVSPDKETENTERQYHFPPHLFLSYQPHSSNLVYGVGVFSPFGIGGREWSDDGPTRFISTKSFVGTMAINPSLAWKIGSNFFIGAGIYYLYSKVETENKLNQSYFGGPDGDFEVDLEGGHWGYDLGIFCRPAKWISLGLSYRSGVDVGLEGDAKFSRIASGLLPATEKNKLEMKAESELNLPPIMSFGMGIYPSKNFTIGLGMDWVGWARYEKITIDFKSEDFRIPFPDMTIQNDWENSWLFKTGIEYRFTENLSLRTGYAFVESPIPDRTLSPASPDGDQHDFTFGFGYSSSNYWLDAFYMLSIAEDRTVQNSILSGTYENKAHYMGFSIGYKF